jgi:hypothetical protein
VSIGLSPMRVVAFETDGIAEQVDGLKSAFIGATQLCSRAARIHWTRDCGISRSSRQIGVDALSEVCRTCPIRRVCGAGHYVHQYQAGSGIRKSSVYSSDLGEAHREYRIIDSAGGDLRIGESDAGFTIRCFKPLPSKENCNAHFDENSPS